MEDIIDSFFLARNQRRYVNNFSEADFLHELLIEDVLANLFIKNEFERLLIISPKPTKNLQFLLTNSRIKEVFCVDFSSNYLKKIDAKNKLLISPKKMPFVDESFDLVVSLLNIHQINNVPQFFSENRRIMKKDGLFLGSLFGIGTLMKLRLAFAQAEIELGIPPSPHFLPLTDIIEITNLMAKIGFKEPVANAESIKVEYQDFLDIFTDLNNMGETNSLFYREKKSLSKAVLNRVRNICEDDYSAIFEVISLCAFR
jgi:NADH dehydrogenase [ubiquinone] 1 alpha subcomplex assembly factor 5